MENKKEYSKDELIGLAKGLYSDGYSFMEIYKYLKQRTDDNELITLIIDNIKSDAKANETRHKTINEKNKELNRLTGSDPYFDLLMGIVLIVLGFVFTKLIFEGGKIHTLSFGLFALGIGMIGRGLFNLLKK